jgi:hypothetical protein
MKVLNIYIVTCLVLYAAMLYTLQSNVIDQTIHISQYSCMHTASQPTSHLQTCFDEVETSCNYTTSASSAHHQLPLATQLTCLSMMTALSMSKVSLANLASASFSSSSSIFRSDTYSNAASCKLGSTVLRLLLLLRWKAGALSLSALYSVKQ